MTEKVSENVDRVSEKVPDVIENDEKLTEKVPDVIENVIEKAKNIGFSMTDTHIKLLQLMLENPYISQADLAKLRQRRILGGDNRIIKNEV